MVEGFIQKKAGDPVLQMFKKICKTVLLAVPFFCVVFFFLVFAFGLVFFFWFIVYRFVFFMVVG